MISYHRIKQVALVALGALLVYAIGMLLYLHHAHAAGDPGTVATTATDAGWELFTTYGWLWGGAGLGYALAQRLLALNANTHWLAQGRILAAITGAVAVLGTVIQWRFQGAPAAGIVAALMGAIALVWQPVVRPALPRIGITALALLALGGSQIACTHNTRTETLQAAQLSVGAARDSLATYDQIEQDDIISHAVTLEDGKTRLASWRRKRTDLVSAIATAYRAIAIAGPLNDQPSLASALTAAGEVVDAIKAIVTRETP
jgi:hypothetical protein